MNHEADLIRRALRRRALPSLAVPFSPLFIGKTSTPADPLARATISAVAFLGCAVAFALAERRNDQWDSTGLAALGTID